MKINKDFIKIFIHKIDSRPLYIFPAVFVFCKMSIE